MRRQVIPKEQVAIIVDGLRLLRFAVDTTTDGEDERSIGFDTISLEGLMSSRVVVELSEEEFNGFGKHKVDYPLFHHPDHQPKTIWARKCSIMGCGMDSGWLVEDEGFYISTELLAEAYVIAKGFESLKEAYKKEFIFYTEWTGDDAQYEEVNNELIEKKS